MSEELRKELLGGREPLTPVQHRVGQLSAAGIIFNSAIASHLAGFENSYNTKDMFKPLTSRPTINEDAVKPVSKPQIIDISKDLETVERYRLAKDAVEDALSS